MRIVANAGAIVRIAVLLAAGAIAAAAEARPRWTEVQANDWYAPQPWLVGANYIPATAINQLEMWQAATWDPRRIDCELGLAQGIGMNTMRVFLHDQLWTQDPKGFRRSRPGPRRPAHWRWRRRSCSRATAITGRSHPTTNAERA